MFRSGIIVSLFTLLSRVFGLFRELFIASLFGSSATADSVNVAFKLPNLFRRIFGEGALSTVFIPMFNAKIIESKDQAQKFTSEVFSLLLAVLIILVILMQCLMPQLMFIIAPGFHEDIEKFNLTVLLCRITIPYLIFIAVVALVGGVLNSLKRFAAFAFSPIILSLTVILGTLALQSQMSPPVAITIALLISGVAQLIFMFCAFQGTGMRLTFLWNPADPDVKRMVINMGPATISAGSQQVALFISQSIASFIPGAVSILSYADRIYQFPLSIIGIAFSTVLLPELSRIYKVNNQSEAQKIQNKAISLGLFFAVPASLGLMMLAQPIIHIIYERGAFSSQDTMNTAKILMIFALGIPAFILNKILTSIFYARQNTKTPLKITLYSLAVNIVLNLVLIIPFGCSGIALGSVIAAWYNVYLLVKYLDYKFFMLRNIKKFIMQTVLCGIIMSFVLLLIKYYYEPYYYSPSYLIKISVLAVSIFIGMAIFTMVSLYCGLHKILLVKE